MVRFADEPGPGLGVECVISPTLTHSKYEASMKPIPIIDLL